MSVGESPHPEEQRGEGRFDELVRSLQQRRVAAGSPSYTTMATDATRVRVERGLPEFEARIARSTVYDLFREGRQRLDVTLLLDVLRGFGAEESEVEEWADRHETALRCSPTDVSDPTTPGTVRPGPEREPAVTLEQRMRLRSSVFIAAATVLLNVAGVFITYKLSLALYFDMVGTAIAAILLGPWWGVAVAVSSNVASVGVTGPSALPFALVNVAGALVWGYGVHRFGMGRSVARFFSLNVMVAVVCSAIAVPLILAIFGGYTEGGADEVTKTFYHLVHNKVGAVIGGNLVTSLADKMISGFVALLVLEAHLARRGTVLLDAPR